MMTEWIWKTEGSKIDDENGWFAVLEKLLDITGDDNSLEDLNELFYFEQTKDGYHLVKESGIVWFFRNYREIVEPAIVNEIGFPGIADILFTYIQEW